MTVFRDLYNQPVQYHSNTVLIPTVDGSPQGTRGDQLPSKAIHGQDHFIHSGPQPIYSGNQKLKTCHKLFRNRGSRAPPEVALDLKWLVPLNAQ